MMGKIKNLKEKEYFPFLSSSLSNTFCILLLIVKQGQAEERVGWHQPMRTLFFLQMAVTDTLPWHSSSSKILHQVPNDQEQKNFYINLCVDFLELKKKRIKTYLLHFPLPYYTQQTQPLEFATTNLQVMKRIFNRFSN